MAVGDWIDARDSEALAQAWSALDIQRVAVGRDGWSIAPHGAAQLAAQFLGWPLDRLAWLGGDVVEMPAPVFQAERTTARCFLEHGVDVREDCYEYWTIREATDGARGVQHVMVASRQDDGTRDGTGTSGTVVRIYDRATDTAASIAIGSRLVMTLGAVDVAALELFEHYRGFGLPTWTHYDPDGVRGILAQLAAELDAHFDVSTDWPARTIASHDTANHYLAELRFESGPRAVELAETRFRRDRQPEDGWVTAVADGLPWGHRLSMTVRDDERGTFGDLRLRLPIALGEIVLARLAHVPGVDLG